jgi:hypothetical protein
VVQVVQAVQAAQVALVWAVKEVVEVADLMVQVDMESMMWNMMEDLSQSDRIHSWREGILFVVGEDHSNSLLTPTILI